MKTIRVVVAIALVACCTTCLIQRKDPETAPERGAGSLFKKSAELYEAGDFASSLEAANESLAMLNEQLAIAHNNICSAHIGLRAYEQAIASCRESLELAPGYERARQNLTWAYERLMERKPSARDYIELSLLHYQSGEMDKCIIAAQNALLIESTNAIAYNNICSAHAQKREWEQAIRACEKALQIAPGYELAAANLAWARQGQAEARPQGR